MLFILFKYFAQFKSICFLWLNTRIKQIRCLNKIFEDENKILKSKLCTRGYKVFTMQSAIDVTSRHETFFQFKEKTQKRRVPLVTTYHPDLMKLSIIPRNDLPICSLTIECQTSSKIHKWMRLNAQGTLAHSNESKTKQPIVLFPGFPSRPTLVLSKVKTTKHGGRNGYCRHVVFHFMN